MHDACHHILSWRIQWPYVNHIILFWPMLIYTLCNKFLRPTPPLLLVPYFKTMCPVRHFPEQDGLAEKISGDNISLYICTGFKFGDFMQCFFWVKIRIFVWLCVNIGISEGGGANHMSMSVICTYNHLAVCVMFQQKLHLKCKLLHIKLNIRTTFPKSWHVQISTTWQYVVCSHRTTYLNYLCINPIPNPTNSFSIIPNPV